MFLRAGKFIRNQEILSVELTIHEELESIRDHTFVTIHSPADNELAVILIDDNTGAIFCTSDLGEERE